VSATYLDAILAQHRERAARDGRNAATRSIPKSARPSFAGAIIQHRSHGVAVVAEVKRKSPSKGWLAEGLDAPATARDYERGGATAISVLTDEAHFGGSLQDLRDVAAASTLPILRKDFTVSVNDVLDAADAGASAVLLIVAALTDPELEDFSLVAADCGLDALVEVHTSEELDRALSRGASLVGVNRRDLHSFGVDAERAAALVAQIPATVVAIAESGFSRAQDVALAGGQGFDAVLVGESFVTTTDKAVAVSEFVGAPIGARRT
jgi:indole-3-glycerol phosphate synthase